MRKLIYSGILLLALIIESTVFVHYRLFHVIPDLLTVLIISGALLRGSLFGIQLGVAAGVIQDLLVGGFGTNIIINIFVSYLAGTLENKIVKEQMVVAVVVVFFLTMMRETLYLLLSEQLIFSIPFLWAVKTKIFPLALANAILIIPVYWLLYRLEKKIHYY